MTNFHQALRPLLASIDRPGDFYATGTLNMHPPRLRVEGVGTIALPLLPMQAEQLIVASEQAPYGRGSETVVDTEVRRTWQIDAKQISIEGQLWHHDLSTLTSRCAVDLGVSGEIEAELYKLLIYDTGSFFVSHRDSEKSPGMFATLVLILPSDFSGGELIVQHQKREVRLDLRRDDPAALAYAAFYADCRHEVLPITDGCRLALIYNLVRRNGGPLPQAPDYDSARSELAQLLREWAQPKTTQVEANGTVWPEKLILPLEHSYSEAELGFHKLKGVDASIAGVVRDAAKEADCDLFLAMLSVREYGAAEYTSNRRGSIDYEITEVYDEERSLHTWRLPDNTATAMGRLSFENEEIFPPEVLDDIAEAEANFHEATGNEGVSFDRQYQRAALVMWPQQRRNDILATGGVEVSVPYLVTLMKTVSTHKQNKVDAHRANVTLADARRLAQAIATHWRDTDSGRKRASEMGHSAEFLLALHRLGDIPLTVDFVSRVVATGGYSEKDNPPLLKILSKLSNEKAYAVLNDIVSGNAGTEPTACARLIADFCSKTPEFSGEAILPAVSALFAALPRTPPSSRFYHRPEPISPDFISASLAAFALFDASRTHSDAEPFTSQALAHFLALTDVYDADHTLIPAALAIQAGETALNSDSSVANQFKTTLIDLLRSRIAEPLLPPSDWSRSANLRCGCTYCEELKQFLKSPTESEWKLKAAQSIRDHAADKLVRARCDVTLTTERRGSPHSLVCKKNQASYENALRQRATDQENLEALQKK